ncbi:MAG: 4-(cytidine 5'-diphospho)-2-C-methyl-D-erythritol kinase [Bacteroidota bacterium]|nr:4-(cytidine 5'-diphospho)-2-C-methyl-D-erythritol kinase [Bacteroidota bacterium]
MIQFPNAKINIGLNIVAKRSDGFHSIESIMYPTGLRDALEFTPLVKGKSIEFKNSGILIDSGISENLVVKAYSLLKEKYKLPTLNIHLHKIIPFGAGLGGGSSDASFMLKGLNQEFELKISTFELEKYAREIGSDCAFFIRNLPSLATGKGERLKPLDFSLKGYFLILVHPGIHINTAGAYARVHPSKSELPISDAIKLPISAWKNTIKNDFEKSVFERFSEIRNLKQRLYGLGAVYASMSGSGSAVYGIFNDKPDIGNLFKNYFVWTEILE